MEPSPRTRQDMTLIKNTWTYHQSRGPFRKSMQDDTLLATQSASGYVQERGQLAAGPTKHGGGT